jgi:Na+/H+-dicarboxylate symporter
MLRSLSVRVLMALVVGLGLGALAAAYGGAQVRRIIEIVEAFGGLWLNALRMTVVPLVFAVLVTGVAGVADAAATGRLALKTIGLIVLLLTASAVYSIVFFDVFYALWPVSPAGAAALKAGASAAPDVARQAPKLIDFIKGLAPSNALKAASEDAILPLVVFAGFFGFAVTRLERARRRLMFELFESLAEAMVTIVGWVLLAAPAGVFALGLGVGLRTGVGAAGEILHYMAGISLANITIILIASGLALTLGRVGLRLWMRTTAPVQVTAFATQSSLVCLPAMIERLREDVGVPDRVTGLVLPLAVALFRMTGPLANYGVALFLLRVYGIHASAGLLAIGAFTAVACSLASVSLPSALSFYASIAPICVVMGIPVDILPILIAVEVIPDIFRTIGNVTADMAIATVLWRSEPAGRDIDAAEPAAA